MKILIIGDLHGSKPKIRFRDFDALICVGDVCSDKFHKPYIKGWLKYLKTHEGISSDEYIKMTLGKKKMKELDRLSLIEGRKIMKFLNSLGKPVFIVPGNWDQSYGKTEIKDPNKNDYSYDKSVYDSWLGKETNPRLIRGLSNIIDCQFKLRKFGGVNFIGYGLSSGPEDPDLRKKKRNRKYRKSEYEKLKKVYAKFSERLRKEYEKRDKGNPVIFISHNMPYNTKFDVILNKHSFAHKSHSGSTVARDFIMRHKPLLCVGGHMHEYFGKIKLGKTTVINAGFGGDKNVLVDIKKKRIMIKFIK